MPYIIPTNRKFCLNCDIADVLLMRQDDFPKEPYDEPYYNPVDKKFQMRTEIEKNFWLGCETVAGCGDGMREKNKPYEAWLGVDKYYLKNIFKYPVTPNDLPYSEPQFAYDENQWVQWKDIFGVQYHFTVNNELSDSWNTHYYKQTNKTPLPTNMGKNFIVTSFKNRLRSTDFGKDPLRLMYKVGTQWVQDSFTSSENPFTATATPANYIIPSTDNSLKYDTDITFSLPEYSGLTEVNYIWNIRQTESGLTLKVPIKQNKKTGTVKFGDGNTITMKGIGSTGSRGVIPRKSIFYSGNYNDGINDTISWYNKTNNLSPATGNFTDSNHANSKGLNDNIRITSDQSWCHDIEYNLNEWTAYVDWWKSGEGQGSPRVANIQITKVDPRLDVVTPSSFKVSQNPPVPKFCYHFNGLSAGNLGCSGGSVSASVNTTIKKKYHDYSPCSDGVGEDYYVNTSNVGWNISPNRIGENTDCSNKTHTITATQSESGLQLSTTITQTYNCTSENYIRNCSVSPSNVGVGGGTVNFSADALYFIKHCNTVMTNDSSFSVGSGPAPGCSIGLSSNSTSAVCDAATTKTITVSSSGSWSSSTNGCSVSPSSGGAGNTNVTVSIPASKSAGSASFSCEGSSATYSISRSGSGCSGGGGGGGDCNCPECKTLWHTDQNIHNLDYRAKKAYFQVYYSCKECKPIPWIVKLDAPLTANVYSGVGYCCPEWQCVDFDAEAKKICIGKTPATFTVNIPENDTGVERIMNMYITQNGEGCGVGQQEWIKQSPKPTGSTCTDCYVAFQNADTRTIESGAKTYSSEPIVKKGTGSGCNIDVNSFSITASDGKTGDVTINPSTGDLSSTNISIAENTSSSDRTFTITIHPNIEEKTTCKTSKSFVENILFNKSIVFLDGEVYSDYTDINPVMSMVRSSHTIPENTEYFVKTHSFTLTNAGGQTCSVSVTQDAAIPPPPPDPDPAPGNGEESDPGWAGLCADAGYDGGGDRVGTIDATTTCINGRYTHILFTCNPRLTGSQTISGTISICDKLDGGVAMKGTFQITASNQDDAHLGYEMDHCDHWWPWIGIDTPGWYRGTMTSN